MEFLFDLFIDFNCGTHLIGSDFPRWRPKSKMATRKKGNVIYLAVKIKNEQMSSSFQFQMLPRDQDQHLSEIAHETHR